MSNRQRLHEMIELIPEDRIIQAIALLQQLDDRDDEPLTSEEQAAIRNSREDFTAGRFVTLEDYERDRGL